MARKRADIVGQRDTATSQWKTLVRQELERRGMTQLELARRLGWSPAAVSRLLSSKSDRSTRNSSMVGPVSKLLGVPVPVPVITSDLQKRWAAALDGLSDVDAEMLIRQARALAKLSDG